MSSRMKAVEEERGKPLKDVIKELWQEYESQEAIADELGVSQGTISLWMIRLGLAFKRVIVEKEIA